MTMIVQHSILNSKFYIALNAFDSNIAVKINN